ncbi:ATP-binding protein [Parahaliea mediterranea]|uniref:histidine kinase n=1 Tax=Parahaliea mediterranea TaxID=651086 RepID=A0A939ILV9_9GAMM|nr:HAMP domain-containing protein [Parahaliea mediterranea]
MGTRTSAWRLTLVFTLIVLLVNAGVLWAVYWITQSERERQLQQSVLAAAATFRQLAQGDAAGSESLRRLIKSRSRHAVDTLLAMETRGQVVGNLSRLPPDLPAYPATARFPLGVADLQGEPSLSIALGTVLPLPDGKLMVARIEGDREQYRREFLLASLIALAIALLVTVVAGLLFNRRIVRRVRLLGEGMARIQSGALNTRLPARAQGDEYDAIARQVNGMLDEIDELLQSVASVTDNIAHDLRTPLSRIRLRLEEASSGAGAAPWLDDTLADLDTVLETFEAMLELSRLEKGALHLEGEPCDLAAIAGDVTALLAPVAEEHGQTLHLVCREPGPVRGDPSLLFRALYNLVDNAIKYAGQGARIEVIQGGCKVTVRDNGPGIPSAECERVFQRLYRLDRSRHTEGTGLGLSIVRAIARLHRARVSLGDAAPGLAVTIDFSEQE